MVGTFYVLFKKGFFFLNLDAMKIFSFIIFWKLYVFAAHI